VSGNVRAGVDIGGTKTEAVLVSDDGAVLARTTIATGHGADEVVATAVEALATLGGAPVSIGVGIPGAVDATTGVVRHAVNLGIERLELGSILSEKLGMPVHVENDVNAAALGAFHSLALPQSSSIGYLNLGTGLAAGIVLGGHLWRGARGAAGEIGHVLVDPAGPVDLDGERGGLEVVASGSGIARQWGGATVTELLDAADAGDAQAAEIRRRLIDGVAASVRILVLTLDVDLIVIGGGLSRLGDRLIGPVSEVFDGWGQRSPFIASLELTERVRVLPADVPVAALGAAHLGAVIGAGIGGDN
jgi:glucokinase